MGLQLADIENDPLVKSTMQAYREAFAEEYTDPDFQPQDRHMMPQLDNPAFKTLAGIDELDSISAAVLSASHFNGLIPFERVRDRLDKDVAAALEILNADVSDDPEAVFKTKNPHVLKVLVATLAGVSATDELKEIVGQMYPGELQMEAVASCHTLCELTDRLLEDGRWKDLPPKLVDKYVEGLENVADIMPSRMFKRVLKLYAQDMKTEIAKAAAEEMLSQSLPPQVDPESRFEQLKVNARKFKPFNPGT